MICELYQQHAEAVSSAIFSHDDTKLITISLDKQLILWDLIPSNSNSEASSMPYAAVELTRVETRCSSELVIA